MVRGMLMGVALVLATVPAVAEAQADPPWTEEIQRQQAQIDQMKADITLLQERVGELERESDWNMKMWERQNQHDLDRWLKSHPVPGQRGHDPN